MQNNDSLATLKSLNVNVIVLLLPAQYVSMILRESFIFDFILSSTTLWMIPVYHQELSPLKWYPEELLSFEIEKMDFVASPYRRLHRGLTEAIHSYEKLKNSTTR